MNKTQSRNILIQTGMIVLILGFFTYFGYNYFENISKRNIGIGFGFMDDTAGFSISQTLISYTEADTFARTFVIGLLNTLLASFIGILLTTALGFLVGLMRMSKNKLISTTALVYVETLRNIPPLLHVLFWYQVVFLNILPPFKESFKVGEWAVYQCSGDHHTLIHPSAECPYLLAVGLCVPHSRHLPECGEKEDGLKRCP